MEIELLNFELPPIGTQCYAILNPETLSVAVFDAPLNAFATVEKLLVETGYSLDGLYFTHGHWDHTLDGHRFNTFGAKTFAHEEDRMFFEDPETMASYSIPGLEMPAVRIDQWLGQGDVLKIAGRPVEIRHVPGHSPGSILYWFSKDGFAITGDAVFNRSIGRTDFPGCSYEELAASIRGQIYTLPDETILYPGHGPQTTVVSEALQNPFVSR